MLSLSHRTTLSVLRSVAAQHHKAKHTDMLPCVGTPERAGLAHAIGHLLGTQKLTLADTAITLDEWAGAIAEHADIEYLNLFDTTPNAFCNRLQRSYRHVGAALAQEAQSLKAFLELSTSSERTLISWLSLQTVSGFMLGALLPQAGGWQTRSLFESAGALWELNAGDVVATDSQRWCQLAQRLPSLPAGITAIATSPLDAATWQALKEKGVAHIVELYSEPALGVIAARRSQAEAFELLSHWHPTESNDYLLCLAKGSVAREVRLGQPIAWTGARNFKPVESEPLTPQALPLWASRSASQRSLQDATAA
ncbi:hypothetical protein RN346_14865 [Halomonas sp. PAMB 3232]|uniref:hypothetical protein n=1 Tax=Halomonas sp. PAMB 3232 TaxID=3075221 RepID=UPI002896C61B|nr:hypothetical protein [Halomonas sp. PAMB 3232]WNL38561.1 hypothetical protein RN346_14865 [Halomonas sp. PAMB 3232]